MRPDQLFPILIPLVVLGIVVLRARRPRRLRLELLWIAPLLIVGMITAGVVFTPHRAPFALNDFALFAAAAALGGAIGWWRAKTVRLTVDPATHEVTSTTSPVGLLIIGGVFIVRFGLRSMAGQEAELTHIDPAIIGDAFLALAAGLVVGQRVEVFIRARRLLAQAPRGVIAA